MTTKRRRTAARRTTAKRTTATPRTAGRTSRPRATGTSRRSTTRRHSGTATTFGAAVGTVVVAFLLGAPWSVRIALLVLVAVGGLGYLLWSRRS